MTTLIQAPYSSGSSARCDAKCYNAKHEKCKCICSGLNHGVGQKHAAKNSLEIKHLYNNTLCIVNYDAIHEILAQQDLSPPKL